MERKDTLNLKIAGVMNIIVGLIFFGLNAFTLLLTLGMGSPKHFFNQFISAIIFTISCGLLILVGFLMFFRQIIAIRIGCIVGVSIIFSWVMMNLFAFFDFGGLSNLKNFQDFFSFPGILIVQLPLIYAVYFLIYLTRASTVEQFT